MLCNFYKTYFYKTINIKANPSKQHMKKTILTLFALMFITVISRAQMTAKQFKGLSCDGNAINLFADLDAGKAVVLFYYMPSCGSCPPPAQKIQKMANSINSMYPGKVKGYAFPFQNSTTCTYSSTWVSSNGLSTIYTPMDSGAADVAYYGGFGMPTVVVLGGKDHKVLFSTLDFSTSDTAIMREKIINMINGTSGILEIKNLVSNISVFPNPANDKVQVELNLSQSSNIKVEVLNILGDVISTIYEGKVTPGILKKEINTENFSNGVYYIRVNDATNSAYRFIVSH